jgi:FdhE protein
MQRTTSGLRADTAARLVDLQRRRPEWLGWLRLLGETERALNDAGWRMPLADDELAAAVPRVDAPLLHGHTLEVDAGRLRRLLRRLAAAAGLRDYRPTAAGAAVLLVAAIRHDRTAIGTLAAADDVDPATLATVADLAALPLLQACGRLLQQRVPSFWPHGYCPICGGWPILAERRGLDRTRRLRCGRCGGDWEIQWLCCIYCGERDHDRLGSLVPDDRGEMLTIETCASCRGYLKSVATLQEIPHLTLLLRDLETVELDLVALDRGYARPSGGGFALDLRITTRPSRLLRRVLRND